jgi:uncharacterized protein (TIGR03905 family)
MKSYTYEPEGTCSTKIKMEIENGIIHNLEFTDGCDGNLKGIAKLVAGRDALEVSKLFAGISCGSNETSCPDQLSKAIMKFLADET